MEKTKNIFKPYFYYYEFRLHSRFVVIIKVNKLAINAIL